MLVSAYDVYIPSNESKYTRHLFAPFIPNPLAALRRQTPMFTIRDSPPHVHSLMIHNRELFSKNFDFQILLIF